MFSWWPSSRAYVVVVVRVALVALHRGDAPAALGELRGDLGHEVALLLHGLELPLRRVAERDAAPQLVAERRREAAAARRRGRRRLLERRGAAFDARQKALRRRGPSRRLLQRRGAAGNARQERRGPGQGRAGAGPAAPRRRAWGAVLSLGPGYRRGTRGAGRLGGAA